MKRYYLSLLMFLLVQPAYADGGMVGMEFIIFTVPIGAICALVMLLTAIRRFSSKAHKVSVPLNVSALILIICAFVSISALASGIDPGFLATCCGLILVSALLIILNFNVGIKRGSID